MLATKCVGFVVSLKESLGKRLKQLREEKGLTQEQLALDAGLYSGKTIRRFESGENAPRLETIEALAVALHCHPQELFKFPWPNDQEM
jgi:transcriptional regulator with XRE-family HTH domain